MQNLFTKIICKLFNQFHNECNRSKRALLKFIFLFALQNKLPRKLLLKWETSWMLLFPRWLAPCTLKETLGWATLTASSPNTSTTTRSTSTNSTLTATSKYATIDGAAVYSTKIAKAMVFFYLNHKPYERVFTPVFQAAEKCSCSIFAWPPFQVPIKINRHKSLLLKWYDNSRSKIKNRVNSFHFEWIRIKVAAVRFVDHKIFFIVSVISNITLHGN